MADWGGEEATSPGSSPWGRHACSVAMPFRSAPTLAAVGDVLCTRSHAHSAMCTSESGTPSNSTEPNLPLHSRLYTAVHAHAQTRHARTVSGAPFLRTLKHDCKLLRQALAILREVMPGSSEGVVGRPYRFPCIRGLICTPCDAV